MYFFCIPCQCHEAGWGGGTPAPSTDVASLTKGLSRVRVLKPPTKGCPNRMVMNPKLYFITKQICPVCVPNASQSMWLLVHQPHPGLGTAHPWPVLTESTICFGSKRPTLGQVPALKTEKPMMMQDATDAPRSRCWRLATSRHGSACADS